MDTLHTMDTPLISVTGHLCIDWILTVDEFPPKGESRRLSSRERYFGGGAANIAAGIAALGGEAELITSVGKDFAESGYERYLAEKNIKTHLYRSETKNCSTAFMVNSAAGDQITYFEWGAGEVFGRAEPPAREFLHMATGDAAYNIRAAQKARFASLDPGQDVKYYTKEQCETLFAAIDLLICNNYELDILQHTTGETAEEIIGKIPMTIITRGKEGSTLYRGDAGDCCRIPAVLTDAKDPTGAGDAYRAGLFTAMKKGYDIETACRVGAVTSSFAVEKTGTQTNLPGWEQMTERFETAFGTLTR